jgi:hypothetical protein
MDIIFAHRSSRLDVMTALRRLGQAGNVEFCFDPASQSSYSGTQALSDLSGNGRDAWLGGGSGAQATDPTFVGTVGRLSKDDYFSVDGGDALNFQSGTPTWCYSWGKDNAVFSLIAWVWVPSGQSQNIWVFSSIGAAGVRRGVRCGISQAGANGRPFLTYGHGDLTTSNLNIVETGVITEGRWQLYTWSISEGSGMSFVGVDDSFYNLTSDTYSSPSPDNPGEGARLFGGPGSNTTDFNGSNLGLMNNGGRIGPVCGLSRMVSQAEIRALFQTMNRRFNV